jgi:phage transcriptional activator, RinA family
MTETTTTIKISRGAFRHVEAELYAYHDTLREIERLRADILNASPEPDRVGGGRGNTPSDRTGWLVSRLLADRRIKTLTEVSEAIRAIYDGLEPSKQKLVQLRYWTKPQLLTWDGIAMELNVSRRQAMRWRDEIVTAIALRVGWR